MGGSASFPITPLTQERIIVVTGASSGLGYEIAKWCAMMGATVIMACRSEQKTKQAIDQMNEEFKAEKTKGTQGLTQTDTLALEYMHVELSSFKSVVNFTDEFKKSGRKLHVLFLNAGLGLAPYSETTDGYETALQVNYLSQFLMTAKLLPIMLQSGEDCRILLMSSAAHVLGEFNTSTMKYAGPPDDFPRMKYYGNSKLYQIMQMYRMVRRFKSTQITVNSIHPGMVDSNFNNSWTGFWACMSPCLLCCAGKSSSRGALCSIDCATNPMLAGVTGVYFDDFKRKQPSATARNETYQEQLWKKTWEYIKDYATEEDIAVMEGT